MPFGEVLEILVVCPDECRLYTTRCQVKNDVFVLLFIAYCIGNPPKTSGTDRSMIALRILAILEQSN